MKCSFCRRPVVLVPSAEERAAKDVTGKSAAYYRSLFTMHSDCQLALRKAGTDEMMRKLKGAA